MNTFAHPTILETTKTYVRDAVIRSPTILCYVSTIVNDEFDAFSDHDRVTYYGKVLTRRRLRRPLRRLPVRRQDALHHFEQPVVLAHGEADRLKERIHSDICARRMGADIFHHRHHVLVRLL